MSVDLSLLWSSLMLKTISLEMAEVKSVRVARGKITPPVQFILENGEVGHTAKASRVCGGR